MNVLIQLSSCRNAENVRHGVLGADTSRSGPSLPIRQRSPIRAPVTSTPDVVRFSPNMPLVRGPGQFGFPLVEVFARVDVDGLIVAAVKLLIADGVADQAAAETATHRAGRADHDLVISRRLVDTGPPRRRIGVRADACEVDRQHSSHAHRILPGDDVRCTARST